MLSLLQRFARLLARKLSKLVVEQALIPADESTENIAQAASRRVLAWLLEKIALLLSAYPWLSPTVAEQAETDLARLAADLWQAPTPRSATS